MSSNLTDLHPLFLPIAQAILNDTNQRIGTSSVRPAVTFRTVADQAQAKANGLSRVSLGWHQFGLAMDVAVITEAGVYVADGTDDRYKVFGDCVRKNGCIWGGDWNHPDWDHCEWHPSFTLTQYLNWLDAHKVATA